MSAATEAAAWRTEMEATLPAMAAQGGGAFRLHVVRPADVPTLIGAAMLGNVDAERLMRAVVNTVAGIEGAPRRRPMLCGSCPRSLRSDGYAVMAALPDVDCPAQGLCLGICLRCGSTPDEIHGKAVLALRKIWPELRQIEVTHGEGGRA